MHVSLHSAPAQLTRAFTFPFSSVFPPGTIKGCYGWEEGFEAWGSFHTLATLQGTASTISALAPEREVALGEWLALEDVARSLLDPSAEADRMSTDQSEHAGDHTDGTLTQRGESITLEQLDALDEVFHALERFGIGPLGAFEDEPAHGSAWALGFGQAIVSTVRNLRACN